MKSNQAVCSECKTPCAGQDRFIVDDQVVCGRCLFGDTPPLPMYPIGYVINRQERDSSDFGCRGGGPLSRIELLPSQRRFMYKLEEERRLTVVYYLHKARPVKSTFSRGLDGKRVGVFASRTPDRLSRIGIQDVRLVRVDGTTVYVEDLDAINGTPVLDIKMCWH